MSALTRILNNQITNSTIIASQKIVAGSITGSLFASNVTVPGDFLITGNLFVLGTSAYTTIASTNTYVNDPLIVLNNGFAGTNTYDEGLIFNRGSSQNRALIWSEYFQEFRLIGTTETGTAYGNVAVSSYQNLHLGNLTVDYTANVTNLNATGFINTSGNISAAVGVFGEINSTGLINTTGNVSASQVSVATLNATGLINTLGNISASEGSFATIKATGYINTTGNISGDVINAATINTLGNVLANIFTGGRLITTTAGTTADGTGQIFLNGVTSNRIDWAAVGTGAPAFTTRSDGTKIVLYPSLTGATTDYALGVDAATLWTSVPEAGDSFNFKWYGATTLAANLSGAGNFTTTKDIVINGTTPASSSATGALIVKGGVGIAGNLYVGAGLQATTIGNVTAAEAYFTNVAITGNLIGGLAQFAAINSTPIGNATASTGDFTTLSAANSLWANASIATTTQGTGAVVIPNGGISVSGNANIGSILTVGGATQLNSTLGVGGISTFTNTTNATSISDGAVIIQGGASVAKDLYVGGNLYVANIVGVTANVITVEDPLLFLKPSYTFPYNYDIGVYSVFQGAGLTTAGNVLQHTAIVRHQETNTWTFASNLAEPGGGHVVFDADTVYDPIKAGNLQLTVTTDSTNATSGALIVAGGAGIGGNIFQTGTQLQTSATNYIFATTPTTVDAFKAAATLNVGANSGTLTIGNPTVVGTQATQALYNTVTDTLNFARAANITMGHTDGTTTLQGNANVQATTASVDSATGALKVKGGVGIGGNIFINDAYIDTAQTNFILGGTPTTVDAFKAAATLNLGANSGTLTIGNPTVVGTQATQALYNTVTDTLNFARAANVTMGHTDGTTTLQGNANIRAVTQSTSFTTGALVVAGGVGVASNVNIKGSNYLTLGKDIAGGVVYPENSVQITANANSVARISIQNVSSSQLATAEFQAFADNGSNISNYIITGITSTTFNSAIDSPIVQPNDGYTYTTGNLVLSGEKDIVISANSLSQVGIRVSATNSNVGVQYSTESTTEKTGAFTVVGGVGIGKDLYVGKGATLNSLRSTNPVQVLSSTSGNVAIFANVATTLSESSEFVVIGGGNTVVQPGVTLKVGSITSMMLPVGPTAGRPSSLFGNVAYDVPGMIRFNSTINNMEFYDGTQWQVTGSTFTVISGRQFSGNVAGGFGNVDGTNTTFTLQANTTTASTIVSINGVMQFPTLAYSVTGDQLEFTEPPAPTDVIDARILTTTSTVSSITNGNGANQFVADDSGASIFTGLSGGSVQRILVDTGGNINVLAGSKITYDQTPTQITATNLTLLDSFSANAYTTAKYIVSMKQGTGNVQAMEALLTQSTVGSTAGTAYVTTYGIVNTGNTMGTLAANVDVSGGWVVNLWLIPNAETAISNVKVMTTYIV
jgi:hypothetical protein